MMFASKEEFDSTYLAVNNHKMLLILSGMIALAFLFLGSIVFLACAAVPLTRPYALSAALWCAVWGPCSIGWMILAGVGLVAKTFITKAADLQSLQAPRLVAAFGWSYLVIGIVVTAVAATDAAWLHQVLVRRMTFSLFRLYATAVTAGIGCILCWCFGWWMMSKEFSHNYLPLLGLGMTTLIVGFGAAAYKGARALRGKAPTNFTWISADEFSDSTRQ